MKGIGHRLRLAGVSVAAVLLWVIAVPAQNSASVNITPAKATLVVGDSQSFRLVDHSGRMQRNVSWSVSDSDSLQIEHGDEINVTAKRSGQFLLRAHSDAGTEEATITVLDGPSLPMGTEKWSGVTVEGCKATKITPAVPSAAGPDMYEQSECPDGQYVTAYTSDGIQLWRTKIGGGSSPNAPAAKSQTATANAPIRPPLDLNANSICDLAVVGTGQDKIRDLLEQRKLPYREGGSSDRSWTVDESSTQCKMWFDEKAVLSKKRKILVSD